MIAELRAAAPRRRRGSSRCCRRRRRSGSSPSATSPALRDWAENGADSRVRTRRPTRSSRARRRGRPRSSQAAASFELGQHLHRARAPRRRRAPGSARRTACSPTTGPTSARPGSSWTRSSRARASSTKATGSATCARSAPRTTTRRSTCSRLRPGLKPGSVARSPRDQAEPRPRRRGSRAVWDAHGARDDGGPAAGRSLRCLPAGRDRAAGRRRARPGRPAARCCCSTRWPRSSTRQAAATVTTLSTSARKWLDPASDDYSGRTSSTATTTGAGGTGSRTSCRRRRGHRDPRLPARRSALGAVHPRPVRAGANQLPGGREGAAAAVAAGLPARRRRRARLVLGRAVPATPDVARDGARPARQRRRRPAHHRRAGDERPRASTSTAT